jgi:hypothetical protein
MSAMAPKKKHLTDEARDLSARVRRALKAEVRRRDFRQLDLELALGRSHGYYSHLFAGRLALTMEGVLEVLLAIGADPVEFFAATLGPEGPGGFRKGGPPTPEDIEATVLRALRRYGYAPGEEDDTKEGEKGEAGAKRPRTSAGRRGAG